MFGRETLSIEIPSTKEAIFTHCPFFLPPQVLTTDIAPQHTAHSTEVAAAYLSTVAEWALFASACSRFVSTDAAWSKSAVAFSLRAQSSWIFWRPSAADGPLEKWEEKCDPEHASRAAELGNLKWWSGM